MSICLQQAVLTCDQVGGYKRSRSALASKTVYKNTSFLPCLSTGSTPSGQVLLKLYQKSLYIQQCYLLYESAALVEESSNIVIRVVINEELLVSQLSLVKAWDDRTGVKYVRYSIFLQ